MSVFQHLLWDTAPNSQTYDVRTPQQGQQESQRVATGGGLMNQYSNAFADPNFGIAGGLPSQSQYRYVGDQAAVDEINRIAAGGGGESGYSAARSAKVASDAIINYKLGISNAQNQARQGVGQNMALATQPGGFQSYDSWVNPQQNSILSQFVGGVAGGAGGGAGSAAGSALGAMLGEGGVVTKPTTALIGEHGPEVVMPVKDFIKKHGKRGGMAAGMS
jgi:hypothetical protein